MKTSPATVVAPAMMAETPKTHFQLEYWATRPEKMLPKALPSGEPAAVEDQLVYGVIPAVACESNRSN